MIPAHTPVLVGDARVRVSAKTILIELVQHAVVRAGAAVAAANGDPGPRRPWTRTGQPGRDPG
jgi:hypothetical protein